MAHNTESEMPSYIKDLLVKMDYIGHVPPGMKVCISSRSYLDPDHWSTRPMRWAYGESSLKTCTYIDNIITKICEILSECQNKSGMRNTVVNKAKIFRQGLINLIETYKDNPDAASKLRTNLEHLDIKIPENKRTIEIAPVYEKDSQEYDKEEYEDAFE